MRITVLKSKISYAKVTQTDLYYVGSITLDSEWMDAANIRENEKVQVVNLNNGSRLETYVIRGDAGSRIVGLNGPAARLAQIGDELFIISYAEIDPEVENIEPIVLDLKNANN